MLNGIAKPSFVPCFLPVFPLAAFVRFGWSPELLRAALLTAGGVGLLALQYAYIYLAELGDRTLHDEPSGIAVDPFVAGIHFLAFWFSTVSYR